MALVQIHQRWGGKEPGRTNLAGPNRQRKGSTEPPRPALFVGCKVFRKKRVPFPTPNLTPKDFFLFLVPEDASQTQIRFKMSVIPKQAHEAVSESA